MPVPSEELGNLYKDRDMQKQDTIGNTNSESLLIDRADAQTVGKYSIEICICIMTC